MSAFQYGAVTGMTEMDSLKTSILIQKNGYEAYLSFLSGIEETPRYVSPTELYKNW